jgi:hypothetical protein
MADLASRITKPEEPVAQDTSTLEDAPATLEGAAPAQDAGDLEDAQTDGAGQMAGGSSLQEINYDVEVSLNEIQRDVGHPLGSVHTFAELGLYVPSIPSV